MGDQLARLSRPFPSKYVSKVAAGGGTQADYVAHSVVTEALLAIVGPYDFHVTEIVRDKEGGVTGCLATLTCEVDGRTTSVTEVGDITGSERIEGSALKNAASDGLKRCAMRLGLGLHLWAGDAYFLHDQLTKDATSEPVKAKRASKHAVTEIGARLALLGTELPDEWVAARVPPIHALLESDLDAAYDALKAAETRIAAIPQPSDPKKVEATTEPCEVCGLPFGHEDGCSLDPEFMS